MTIPSVMEDVGVLLDYTAGHAEATNGCCMSGPCSLFAAERHWERLIALYRRRLG